MTTMIILGLIVAIAFSSALPAPEFFSSGFSRVGGFGGFGGSGGSGGGGGGGW